MRNAWMFLTALAIVGASHAQVDSSADQDRKLGGGDPRAPGATAAPRKGAQSGPVRGPGQMSGISGKDAQAPEIDSRRQAEPSANETSAQEAQKRAVQAR